MMMKMMMKKNIDTIVHIVIIKLIDHMNIRNIMNHKNITFQYSYMI